MRGQLLKSRFFRIISLLCLGSLLVSLIWYKNNGEPNRLPPQKKNPSQLSEPCKGCSKATDKVAESNAEMSKKQEDKPDKIREGNNKAVEQNSKISKKQENKPQKVKDNDKTVEQNSKISKKQEDKPQKVKEGNDKAVEQNFKISKKQDNNLQKVKEVINKAVQRYSQTWKKQEDNYQKFRSNLSSKCHGLDKAIITQNNTPVGSQIVSDLSKSTLQVTPELFSIFMKEHPFYNKTRDTCSIVGNGGILINSSCGESIDLAQFVIRCNLPPLANGFEKHVGVKTDLVTANPSIFFHKYGALMGRRRPFVESLRNYGNSLLLLHAFSFSVYTAASLRAIDAINDSESPIRPVFLNPEYLNSLFLFWRSRGLRETRLSTGLIMASLALELCSNVHLYGFWPFSYHPRDLHPLTNHYYDNVQTKTQFHAMPAEFDLLMRLHNQGVLRLHLGDCPTGGK